MSTKLVTLPAELFDELAEPPVPPFAVVLFVLDEFPELVNMELPLFFTTEDPPVAVAEPPVDVLVELPPVTLEVDFEFALEFEVAFEFAEEFCV